MGCTSGKQYNNSGIIMKTIPNEKEADKDQATEIISSIQKIVNQLESYYTKIVSQNTQIPEEFALLQPSDFLEKLRETNCLTCDQINEIEQRLMALFSDLSKIINQASYFLFDYQKNKSISKEKRNILLTFIMLYEKTCNQFFAYQKESNTKKMVQSIETSQKLNKRLSKSNEDCSTQSYMLSTVHSKRLIN